tara:strand:+ start:337 stop:2322 length:1986 start_codon:yes stop_codon:yes gene_type:complete
MHLAQSSKDTSGAASSSLSKPNILDTLKLDKALRLAEKKIKEGLLGEAQVIYQDILHKFSKNKKALIGLQLLSTAQEPTNSQLQVTISLFKQRNFQQALANAAQMLKIFPNSVTLHNISGASNASLMQFDAAIESYSQTLKINPNLAEVHYNIGNSYKNKGDLNSAMDSFNRALKIKPDFADAYYNLGIALADSGDLSNAIKNYSEALKIKPNVPEVHYNMGIALSHCNTWEAAIESFKKAVDINPSFTEAYNNMGVALDNKGEYEAAIASYNKAIKTNPNYAEAYCNTGVLEQKYRKYQAAEENYRQAIALKPDYAEAHSNLAITLIAMGKQEDALIVLKSSHELIRGQNPANPFHKSFLTISKAKIDHDIEQFTYLANLGYEVEKFNSLSQLYKQVSLEIDWSDEEIFLLSAKHQHLLKEAYNRPVNISDAPKVMGGALNNTLQTKEITKSYFSHGEGLTYIDDFLTPEALKSLKHFLLGSTIWFEVKKGGYLGAYLSDGLACPLLLQIADNLRKKFPEVFKNHQLNQLWAFKYDSNAHKDNNNLTGIKKHADFAAVNVNFWITPAAANLNPESGGLVVYDSPAPLEWDFKVYNTDVGDEKIIQHLKDNSSGYTRIPYNENRAVIFNSNLIHETDKFEFKQGYENRRINITMLFGLRED